MVVRILSHYLSRSRCGSVLNDYIQEIGVHLRLIAVDDIRRPVILSNKVHAYYDSCGCDVRMGRLYSSLSATECKSRAGVLRRTCKVG